MSPPTGTVTFVFTDIEGSSRLWEQDPEAMRPSLARHDALFRDTFQRYDGFVFKTAGDAFYAAFATANQALGAALAAQQALVADTWDLPLRLRVRMALHTGDCDERDGDYFGRPLNRTARLLDIGHGGQVLLSSVTRGLVLDSLSPPVTLRGLGERRLKDLGRPEHVYQLAHPALPADFPPLRSLDNPTLPNNLPQQMTGFIGREKELAEIKALMQRSRLVTLAGTGGAGKSRLSVQIAADLLDRYPEGAWLVELAPLTDSAGVPQAVASALGVREQAGQTLAQTLTEFLRAKTLLLVLDNCEHLLAACATLVSDLLRVCPNVHVLASSREAMNVAGEQIYRVPSLALADPRLPQTAAALSQYEAVALFIERAQAVRPEFAVTDANAPAVAQICWRLDGIPLALELAAARVRAMPVEQVMVRLDDRFKLLTGGSRTVLPRQQTLRALVDWSYDLLSDSEKRLLQRLSVFAGNWTLEMAEAVCSGDGLDEADILDLLTQLLDKSLVLFEEQGSDGRYHLLETLREYSRERLQEVKEDEPVRRRHRDWCLALATQAEPELRGPGQLEWLDRLEREYGNLRAAMEWGAAQDAGSDEDARLVTALWHFWWIRGHFTEGRERLTALLHRAEINTRFQAKARVVAGILAYFQYDFAEAIRLVEEGVALARQTGDRWLLGFSLVMQGFSLSQMDPARSTSCLAEGLTIARAVGDRWLIAEALSTLGQIAHFRGELVQAKTHLEEALSLCRETGDQRLSADLLCQLGMGQAAEKDFIRARDFFEESLVVQKGVGDQQGMVASLLGLGHTLLELGSVVKARAFFLESLTMTKTIGSLPRIANSLEGFARVAIAQSQLTRAASLFAAATVIRGTAPVHPIFWRALIDHDTTTLQITLSEGDFSTAHTRGQAMTFDEAIAYASSAENVKAVSSIGDP